MDVFGEFDLLGSEVAASIFRELLAQDQHGIQRGAQFVGHVGQELGLVFGREGEFRGLFLQGAAGLFHLLVLTLDFGILIGELLGLLGQLLVGLLQFLLLRLQFDGQLL